jgi:hypothetical protein
MPGRAVLESVAEQIAHELYGGETVTWGYVIDGDIDEMAVTASIARTPGSTRPTKRSCLTQKSAPSRSLGAERRCRAWRWNELHVVDIARDIPSFSDRRDSSSHRRESRVIGVVVTEGRGTSRAESGGGPVTLSGGRPFPSYAGASCVKDGR